MNMQFYVSIKNPLRTKQISLVWISLTYEKATKMESEGSETLYSSKKCIQKYENGMKVPEYTF